MKSIDNCSIHKGKEIEAMIQAAGASLIYLPPYSPDFSPIENCWSKIKSILRSIGARNYPSLAKAIEEAFNKVRTYANNSRNLDFQVGAIHELPLQRVVLRKS
ncbi:transposase [Nostoc sp. WHI]|uniref:transposase n=1 Tax=Nostoc sp. WHI TaxID=2650611 RepID=UPI0018C45EE3|nr:transposase [Nostoc sp. WHI]